MLGGEAAVPVARLPDAFAVNADAWAATKALQSVFVAMREALTRRPSGDKDSEDAQAAPRRPPASRVVFCGHGAAAAVATLLALQYRRHMSASTTTTLPSGPPTLLTYGCPLMGNAALQTVLRRQLPATTRWYVDHDPVAGLPRWSTIGLRFSPPAQAVAPHGCRAHRVLSPDGVARAGVAGAPRVVSLAVAGVAFRSHHRLEAYALCLTRQWAGRGVAGGGGGGGGGPLGWGGAAAGLRRLWRRMMHVAPPGKGSVAGGGGGTRDGAHRQSRWTGGVEHGGDPLAP